MRRALLVGLALALPVVLVAGDQDPRERSFQFFVDGAQIPGVVGYRIDFRQNPAVRTDSRRLGNSYSPDERRLSITLTQKGLARLQEWLNSATDTLAPTARSVIIVARTADETTLARWELTAVTPLTFSSAGAGTMDEVDATVEFTFDRLRLLEAKPD